MYTANWLARFLVALIIALTGVRPLKLVDLSIGFGIVIMPLTYYPLSIRSYVVFGLKSRSISD